MDKILNTKNVQYNVVLLVDDDHLFVLLNFHNNILVFVKYLFFEIASNELKFIHIFFSPLVNVFSNHLPYGRILLAFI
jgi:hypothetical protein